MTIRYQILSLSGALLLAGAAQAATPSSFSESAGYQNCARAAAGEVQVIKLDADYYIYQHTDSRRYYLNGHAFIGGDSQAVKVACETTLSGNRILNVAVDNGSYAARQSEPVEVATN